MVQNYNKLRPNRLSSVGLQNNLIDDAKYVQEVQTTVISAELKREEQITISGEFAGYTVDKPHLHLVGIGDATFTKSVVVKESSTFSNISFNGDGLLVEIKAGTVIFRDCDFVKDYNAGTSLVFVSVAQGAYASFVGCRFRSDRDDEVMNAAGTVVQSDALNPVANVSIVGGSNRTTWTNSNTTDLGVV